MPLHLLLRLEAPLMSFGTLAVDANRPVQRWPATSMLTGLLANALGWRRTDSAALDRLQERLRWAARIDRPGVPLTDFQTAQLGHDDEGWTTRGVPEGRTGGKPTYDSPYLRLCEYRADASVAMAVRLEPADEAPTLTELAVALKSPQRPLFIGRKSCLPALPLFTALHEATDAIHALAAAPLADGAVTEPTVFFSGGAVLTAPVGMEHVSTDQRSFVLDVHTGQQTVYECAPGRAAIAQADVSPEAGPS